MLPTPLRSVALLFDDGHQMRDAWRRVRLTVVVAAIRGVHTRDRTSPDILIHKIGASAGTRADRLSRGAAGVTKPRELQFSP